MAFRTPVAALLLMAVWGATLASAAPMLDKACDFTNLKDKLAICDISSPNVTSTYGCWSMERGGKGAPSPRAVRPGDVFGVQFLNPQASRRAYRVEGGSPLVFNATAESVDAEGLVEPSAPVAAAWEFLSAVLPRAAGGQGKEQAALVDGAAGAAARRARLEGVVRELEGPAFDFQSGVSRVLADNPCWRPDLSLQPGERLVCAVCFSRLSGPLRAVSFGPAARGAGEAARRVVAEDPAGASVPTASSSARMSSRPSAVAAAAGAAAALFAAAAAV